MHVHIQGSLAFFQLYARIGQKKNKGWIHRRCLRNFTRMNIWTVLIPLTLKHIMTEDTGGFYLM